MCSPLMVQSVATPDPSPAATKQGDKDSQTLRPAPAACSCSAAEELGEADYCSNPREGDCPGAAAQTRA